MGVKVKLNSAGMRALLRDRRVQQDLDERAERIAAAAGDGVVARSSPTAQRARAVAITATPKAMRAEATDRALTRAFDAGRG